MKNNTGESLKLQGEKLNLGFRVWKIKEAMLSLDTHMASYLVRGMSMERRKEALRVLKEGSLQYNAFERNVRGLYIKVLGRLEKDGVCINAVLTIHPAEDPPVFACRCDNGGACPDRCILEDALALAGYWYMLTEKVTLVEDIELVPQLEKGILGMPVSFEGRTRGFAIPGRPDDSKDANAGIEALEAIIGKLTTSQVEEILALFEQNMAFIFIVHNSTKYFTLHASAMQLRDEADLKVWARIDMDLEPYDKSEEVMETMLCDAGCKGERCIHRLALLVAGIWHIKTGLDDMRDVRAGYPELEKALRESAQG